MLPTLIFALSIFANGPNDYDKLAAIREDLSVRITAFESDGCSGGMSALWTILTQSNEKIAEQIGAKPPWEFCCIKHDIAYWLGGSSEERLEADSELRSCVETTGYPTIAGIMYQMVRIGGVPCSGLPWRWGFGWPACD